LTQEYMGLTQFFEQEIVHEPSNWRLKAKKFTLEIKPRFVEEYITKY